MKKGNEWFLVINAACARILRGLPDRGQSAAPELVVRTTSKKLSDLMSDKPGRSFSSGSPGRRSAMVYGSDPVEEERRVFIREVITLLEAHRKKGDFDSLTIFSAPDMLGILRDEIPQALKACTKREITKNLAGLSESSLPERVREETAAAFRKGE